MVGVVGCRGERSGVADGRPCRFAGSRNAGSRAVGVVVGVGGADGVVCVIGVVRVQSLMARTRNFLLACRGEKSQSWASCKERTLQIFHFDRLSNCYITDGHDGLLNGTAWDSTSFY